MRKWPAEQIGDGLAVPLTSSLMYIGAMWRAMDITSIRTKLGARGVRLIVVTQGRARRRSL